MTGSFGAAYTWNEVDTYSTRVYTDAIYGSGLRQDGGGLRTRHRIPFPTARRVPAYYSVNLGADRVSNLPRTRC